MIPNRIRLITGLHIGGNDDTMKIGGVDNSVIKRNVYAKKESGEIHYCTSECSDAYHGQNKIESFTEPYIPGSSLKGKMRSLLEYAFGLIKEQSEIFKGEDEKYIGKPIDSKFVAKCRDRVRDRDNENLQKLQKKAQLIIMLFGESADNQKDNNSRNNDDENVENNNSAKNSQENIKITRAIFRDSFLSKESRKLYLAHPNRKPFEIKAENTIDRVKVTANPRFMERVPSGLEFDCEVVLRDFGLDDDKKELLTNTLYLGFLLLQNDYLGGGGSRGSGRVELFDNKKLKEMHKDIAKNENLKEHELLQEAIKEQLEKVESLLKTSTK
ncbi:type III-A CRISPR-associated RAMP protein Csm3 [Helicobacter cetorum]|uniref:type III-A CRISPR-associated RAMP protein Csm3 n=1 Tax=Helicobacter cetorum TaxID=138563 RepID=UPI000CF172E2|nr:type III-A CRISPR-associated RAMP protein Csm3 [Helicobacter cetorum]